VTYTLSQSSLDNLAKVHLLLVRTVKRAITITRQDFTVFEGVRTITTQREYVKRGVSQTLHSKHLIQNDGYAHAVDLVPWIAGRARWEMGACYAIAEAMREAFVWWREADAHKAYLQGLQPEPYPSLVWGGAWHEPISETEIDAEELSEQYIDVRREQGRKPFLDGPHFQIKWS
jgi:peptidoglycan L-alanyl-D-glutamate endopeptidase CwlK